MTHNFWIPAVCAKPRQTRSDKWKQRPAVVKYRQFCDLARIMAGTLPPMPDKLDVSVYVAIPKSWSKRKQEQMVGKPHRQRPDADNFLKAAADALYPNEDSFIWHMEVVKKWSTEDATYVVIEKGET